MSSKGFDGYQLDVTKYKEIDKFSEYYLCDWKFEEIAKDFGDFPDVLDAINNNTNIDFYATCIIDENKNFSLCSPKIYSETVNAYQLKLDAMKDADKDEQFVLNICPDWEPWMDWTSETWRTLDDKYKSGQLNDKILTERFNGPIEYWPMHCIDRLHYEEMGYIKPIVHNIHEQSFDHLVKIGRDANELLSEYEVVPNISYIRKNNITPDIKHKYYSGAFYQLFQDQKIIS